MYPRRGFLLELTGTKKEVYSLPNKIQKAQGVFLRQAFMLLEKLDQGEVDKLKNSLGNKLLILDLRLEHPLLEDYHSLGWLLRKVPFDAITVMGIYGKEPILTAFKETKTNVLAIIDIGTKTFRSNFPDKAVVSFANTAKECGCRGVVMSTPFLPE